MLQKLYPSTKTTETSTTTTQHAKDVFSAIASCSWDNDTKNQTTSSSSSSTNSTTQEDLFERRGLSLSILQKIAAASEAWPKLRRVLLMTGESAIVLESLENDSFLVEARTLDECNVVQRDYRTISSSDILQDVDSTVGERVFVRKREKKQRGKTKKGKKSAKKLIQCLRSGCHTDT